ncbi:MAG TPA: hypothetical protein VFL51_00945 [Pseudolabrys sp.]|nr:hypothetical protein [Pseudolabrys sp.]
MAGQFRKSVASEQGTLVSYLEIISEDLARLARGQGLETLGYLFELARLEAKNIKRHSDAGS